MTSFLCVSKASIFARRRSSDLSAVFNWVICGSSPDSSGVYKVKNIVGKTSFVALSIHLKHFGLGRVVLAADNFYCSWMKMLDYKALDQDRIYSSGDLIHRHEEPRRQIIQ